MIDSTAFWGTATGNLRQALDGTSVWSFPLGSAQPPGKRPTAPAWSTFVPALPVLCHGLSRQQVIPWWDTGTHAAREESSASNPRQTFRRSSRAPSTLLIVPIPALVGKPCSSDGQNRPCRVPGDGA
jgi:hypothetical protein